MQEVKAETVDPSAKLWKCVKLGFGVAPVIVVLPITDEFLDPVERRSVTVSRSGQQVRARR